MEIETLTKSQPGFFDDKIPERSDGKKQSEALRPIRLFVQFFDTEILVSLSKYWQMFTSLMNEKKLSIAVHYRLL